MWDNFRKDILCCCNILSNMQSYTVRRDCPRNTRGSFAGCRICWHCSMQGCCIQCCRSQGCSWQGCYSQVYIPTGCSYCNCHTLHCSNHCCTCNPLLTNCLCHKTEIYTYISLAASFEVSSEVWLRISFFSPFFLYDPHVNG